MRGGGSDNVTSVNPNESYESLTNSGEATKTITIKGTVGTISNGSEDNTDATHSGFNSAIDIGGTSAHVETILNFGSITATGNNSSTITVNDGARVDYIQNSGSITGPTSGSGVGIEVSGTSTHVGQINISGGTVTGSASGAGMRVRSGTVDKIVISGDALIKGGNGSSLNTANSATIKEIVYSSSQAFNLGNYTNSTVGSISVSNGTFTLNNAATVGTVNAAGASANLVVKNNSGKIDNVTLKDSATGTLSNTTGSMTVNNEGATITSLTQSGSGTTTLASNSGTVNEISASSGALIVTANAGTISAIKATGGAVAVSDNTGTISGVTLSGSAAGTFANSTGSLTINNQGATVTSLTQSGNGTTTLAGNSGTITAISASDGKLNVTANAGTISAIQATGGEVELSDNTGTISNVTLSETATGTFTNSTGSLTVNNQGATVKSLTQSGSGTTTLAGNTGTVSTINASGGAVAVSGNAGTIKEFTFSGEAAGQLENAAGGTMGSIVSTSSSAIGLSNAGAVTSMDVTAANVYNSGAGTIDTISLGSGTSYVSNTNTADGAIDSVTGKDSGHFTVENTGSITAVTADDNSVGWLENSGTVQTAEMKNGGILNITNNNGGAIETVTASSGASVTNNAGAHIGSVSTSDKVNLANSGTIDTVVVNAGGSTTFENAGSVGSIENNGSLTITDWDVTLGSDGLVDNTTTTSGSGTTVFENVTLSADSDLSHLTDHIDVSNVLGNNIAPENFTLDQALVDLGLTGTYDNQEGIYYLSADNSRLSGTILSQTLANHLVRRDFFVDTALADVAIGAFYHRQLQGASGTVFVKPYYSHNNYDLATPVDGHTTGVLIGANAFVGKHIITPFIGFESSDNSASASAFHLTMDMTTAYAGVAVAHALLETDDYDLFVKGDVKAAYTDIDMDRTLVTVSGGIDRSESDTSNWSYSVGLQTGLNWRLPFDGQLVPMAGVRYLTGKSDEYAMHGSSVRDVYTPDRVDLVFGDVSLTWFQGWGKWARTFLGAGYRYNFTTEQDTKASFGTLGVSGTYELPRHYEYVNANLVLHVSPTTEIGFGYTAVFDETGASHNGTLKYEMHF